MKWIVSNRIVRSSKLRKCDKIVDDDNGVDGNDDDDDDGVNL
eukprot:CAMPEP_0170787828 /NCGR_PEP_ID=MMETSP0733-20121128/18517_2 /TAXON_ID=186038 /ORGANISM="Fragilariopsis kerguelensis, Strain L26-C5" /LENGTH=41 /DNA_ID= /DNA_START= /DNA_END= /DNA_ORIENTATION=